MNSRQGDEANEGKAVTARGWIILSLLLIGFMLLLAYMPPGFARVLGGLFRLLGALH